MRKKIHITGMTCVHCKTNVEDTLNSIVGIRNATVDLKGGYAIAKVNRGVEDQTIEKALKAIGYKVVAMEQVKGLFKR